MKISANPFGNESNRHRISFGFCTLVLLFCMISCAADKPIEKVQENMLLSLSLRQKFPDGGFTVVNPKTSMGHLNMGDRNSLEQAQRNIAEHLRIEGYEIGPLVGKLFERNRNPVMLTLESSPRDGYLIDYEGEYEKYFTKDGGGWAKWYKDHPKAHGYTNISLPAYDPESGIMLIYTGTQTHWLAGAGFIVAYRYENGSLKELGRVMMWIS